MGYVIHPRRTSDRRQRATTRSRPPIPDSLREGIFKKFDGICQYCFGEATVLDHIVPWHKCKSHEEDNLIPACRLCNGLVSGKVFYSLSAKKAHIRAVLLRYYSLAKKIVWTEAELTEIKTGKLKKYIRKNSVVVATDEEREGLIRDLEKHRNRLRSQIENFYSHGGEIDERA